MVADSEPTLEEWSRLYEAAIGVKAMAPWQWMEEADVFGVQNPEGDGLGFVSVMGILGEHLSVAVYLGAEGLSDFWALSQLGDAVPAEAVLGIAHMQASFEDREQLTSRDRDVIKALGLRFRGRQAWPLFRSYRSGYLPWHLEAPEVRFLALVLEQTMDVAPRFKEDPTMWDDLDSEDYLMRVPREEGQVLQWEDQIVGVPPVEPAPIPLIMTREAVDQARQLPRGRHTLEVDSFMMPTPTADERDDRPFFPHMLLVVERDSGMVLGSELLKPEPSLEAMWGSLSDVLARQLVSLGSVPAQIKVRTPFDAGLLQPLADELGIEVKVARVLRSLDEAMESLIQWFA
jgi:hypothetical protein